MAISKEKEFALTNVSWPSIGNRMVNQLEISNSFYNFNQHFLLGKEELSIVRRSIGQTFTMREVGAILCAESSYPTQEKREWHLKRCH